MYQIDPGLNREIRLYAIHLQDRIDGLNISLDTASLDDKVKLYRTFVEETSQNNFMPSDPISIDTFPLEGVDDDLKIKMIETHIQLLKHDVFRELSRRLTSSCGFTMLNIHTDHVVVNKDSTKLTVYLTSPKAPSYNFLHPESVLLKGLKVNNIKSSTNASAMFAMNTIFGHLDIDIQWAGKYDWTVNFDFLWADTVVMIPYADSFTVVKAEE